jgi:hypothetical protein
MYDEFERAMTGRSTSSRMSVLGWLAAAFGFFFLVGLVGIGFAINRAMNHVENFARDFEVGAGLADLAMLADLDAQKELISMDPDRGLEFLRGLESGDPAEAFMGQVVRGTFDLAGLGRHAPHARHARHAPELPAPPAPPAPPDAPAAPEAPSVSAQSADASVQVDVDRSDGGRSLVINADGEQVRFDLVRTENGGFLTIDSKDGQTRIDLVGRGEGGYLAIDSEDGSVRFDVTKGDDGAQLLIQSADGTVRLGVGDEAQAMPGWVPRFDGMPERPRPVYSLDASEGILGAVSWSGSATPAEILSYYRGELEAQGYDLREEVRAAEDGSDEGAFWARNEADGRVVFVVAHAEASGTKVLLGYGEEH